ncbi:hypothetical protein ACFX15_014275 [Malus domestica]
MNGLHILGRAAKRLKESDLVCDSSQESFTTQGFYIFWVTSFLSISDSTILAFNSILLMNSGQILIAAPYEELLASSPEFRDLINVHDDTARFETQVEVEQASTGKHKLATEEIEKVNTELPLKESSRDQLIKQEQREIGDTGFKPYIQYLKPSKGFLYFSVCILLYSMFIVGQLIQYYWLASKL